MQYYTLVKALKDTLGDRSRKRITQEDVTLCCDNLAKTIRQSYLPNFIVAIDTGGSVPGEFIGKTFGVPVIHITIRRNIKIKSMYNLDPMPMRWIMSLYHHYLFHTTKPTLTTEIGIDLSGKNILIVDDVFHTGATIDVAIEYLKKMSVSQIKTASLSYVSKRRPDFLVLLVGNYCFPWSKDFNSTK